MVQEEIEVLDQDIRKLEDELEECWQSCSSILGVVFPAMDIRLKSNLAKSSYVHSVERQPARLPIKNTTIKVWATLTSKEICSHMIKLKGS